MEEVADLIHHIAGRDGGEASRKELIDGLRNLANGLETADDTMQRVMYAHLQITAVRIGVDLKIFDLLVASKDAMTVNQLLQKTRAAPTFLGRLLRYLASIGTIKEAGRDRFSSTNVTEALAIPGNQAGICQGFDTLGPVYQALPDFLLTNRYQDITDNANTAFQVGHKTDLPAFNWFVEHSQAAAYFNEYMMHRRKDQPICWDVYPVEQEAQDWNPEATVLVDIGGNIGHQCAEFKKKFPKVKGHVVLEDLAGPIGMALATPGVQKKIHDVFTPQPIKGAKFYYLRAILHDWPDHKCRDILRNITPAMGPESVILIDEMVLPNEGVHWQSTQVDLTMMAALAAMERTQAQWSYLLDSVDLKIANIHTYTPLVYESIMTVVRK